MRRLKTAIGLHEISISKFNTIFVLDNTAVTAVQRQTAVTAYLSSEQLLLFAFAQYNALYLYGVFFFSL